MAQLKVRDIMNPNKIYTIKPNEDLLQLYEMMKSNQIRHVPVTDKSGSVLGIVSDRDLLRHALCIEEETPLSQSREYLQEMRVSEIMVKSPETVEADQPIEEVADLLLENKFSSLPVVENDKLIGIVTESDFVKYVRDHISELV